MATFTLTLDTRREKKNGTYPVVFRVSLKSKPLFITTGISVKECEFDYSNNIIKNSSDLNLELVKLDNLYRSRFYQFIISNPNTDELKELKEFILYKPTEKQAQTIYDFWCAEIKQMKLNKRLGGAAIYQQSLNTISKELNLTILFHKLTYKDIVSLETKLYQRGMSANGISVYLRTFRAICNKAIKMELVSFEWYPFRKYTIKKEKTSPRVLATEELISYFNLEIPEESPKYKYWCIGKLLFMCRGINLRDLLLLNESNLKGDRLIYKRAKTGKLYSIALTPEIKTTLEKFTPNETLLGLVNTEILNSPKRIALLQQKVKIINKHLTHFGKLIGSNEAITSYVFRYSYANLAKRLGYSKDIIAEALGHEYGNSVTGIYLEQFDLSVVDEMNDRLIRTVLTNNFTTH